MKSKLRKDDRVKVIAGNDKGAIGKILAISGNKVIVEKVNVKTKTCKHSAQQKTSFIQIERPIDRSNVMLCPEEQPHKLYIKNEGKKKELYYKLDGKKVVYRKVKQVKK